ncbi:hypothetical protein AB0D94_06480 [Streptomyces sp. NPDC048255]|uniref:hypothetical protein n=1 Tax=Streptomyces sp. NPDC048255 TaxID=3154713 RepID=UPI0033D0FB4D
MRLRTTAAAVFVGAVALVLPTAGPSPADDTGGRGLGTLHYRFYEQDGDERRAQIRPADNDTCYLLTHTSRNEPAVEVVNQTRSQAVLYDNQGCAGRPARVLAPGQRARDLEVIAVFFRAVDGRGDQGRGDQGGDQGGEDPGRGDQGRGDQGRGDQGSGDETGEDQGRGEQGTGDQGRGEQGRGDQGTGDQGRGEQGRGDQGTGDQGRGEQGTEDGVAEDGAGNADQGGRGETGRGDNASDTDQEGAEGEEEDLITRIFRSIG